MRPITRALVLALAGAALVPAGAAADERVAVCAAELDVQREPNQGWSGTLDADETFKVRKLSDSGKYAYGFAYGDMNRRGWVRSAGLCRTGDGPHAVAASRVVDERVAVCSAELDVKREPNQGWSGTLEANETFAVRRLSDSGKYAYGFAYGDINRRGWVRTAHLCR